MSEVQDAVQLINVAGKGLYLTGKGATKLITGTGKVINTLYLGKWKGKASFERLRQIKGDNFMFINISSEDPKKLKAIEKEMKAHGILYAKLPDLCGGDGRTQYAVSESDEGEYIKAKNIFKVIKEYEDSSTLFDECIYQIAINDLKNEDYDAAYRGFKSITNYSDSKLQMKEVRYQQANSFIENGEYKEAGSILTEISDYKDATVLIENSKKGLCMGNH